MGNHTKHIPVDCHSNNHEIVRNLAKWKKTCKADFLEEDVFFLLGELESQQMRTLYWMKESQNPASCLTNEQSTFSKEFLQRWLIDSRVFSPQTASLGDTKIEYKMSKYIKEMDDELK